MHRALGGVTRRRTHVTGLFTLPSGGDTSGSSRLLYSARMRELLDRLRQEFDAILIDTPPLLSVVDARILSRPYRLDRSRRPCRSDDA